MGGEFMSVEKIILRSLLSTLAAIALLLVLMVGSLVAFFPETMMNVSYDMGMEKSSVWFAERAYKRHDDIDVIAFATTVAIEEDMYDKIISCGERMTEDEEFEEYCAARDLKNAETYGNEMLGDHKIVDILGRYDQYIFAQISIAQYKKGDKDGAAERAKTNTVGFPRNNPIACLLLEADSEGDEDFKKHMTDIMRGLSQENWHEDDIQYYNEINSFLEAV